MRYNMRFETIADPFWLPISVLERAAEIAFWTAYLYVLIAMIIYRLRKYPRRVMLLPLFAFLTDFIYAFLLAMTSLSV